MELLIGGIEAGGTKFVCAVGNENGEISDKVSFPTSAPEETLSQAKAFFNKYSISALGVGSFGPIDLNRKSDTYGTILNTPKLNWKNFALLEALQSTLQVPVYLDTDVNAAALGEYKYGAGKAVDSCLYITVGTGIGAGFVQDGKIFQGVNHTEMGHIFVTKHKDDPFAGSCPYHGSCLEGLASGTAIKARYGKEGHLLQENKQVWKIEAFYLAQAILNYYLILSPEIVILGGGVMKQEVLYTMVREKFIELLNGYTKVSSVDNFIVKPGLGDEAGVVGAMLLATYK